MSIVLLACLTSAAVAAEPSSPVAGSLRVATFNIYELDSKKLNDVDAAGKGVHPQACKAAEILQIVRPDVVLLNEIDFDESNATRMADLFQTNYLRHSQNGRAPLDYPNVLQAPVNTGVRSGLDFNNDGKTDGPDDAYGFGKYAGQYGMAILSRHPFETSRLRTFHLLPWSAMPNHLMPDGEGGRPKWYDKTKAAAMRLSSKSHWDAPILVDGRRLHLFCSHPTPPVFDGAEDRNGRRNYDEIRFWADYLSGGAAASYIVDDAGRREPAPADATGVVLGDLNAEPYKGEPAPDGKGRAIELLTKHPKLRDPVQTSKGALEGKSAGAPLHLEQRTSYFGRLDYALPTKDLTITGAGVFWPEQSEPTYKLIDKPDPSSDHRIVWVDLKLPN
ncbi:MAG: endonuclease/exonuclease/phosphatase family protein [Planctomycetia bacterium]